MWTAKVNYGSRWIAETVFSVMKRRIFKEYVSARNSKHGKGNVSESIII
jgi:hypothetical protein